MFTFLPELFIIVSVAGIIILVLRKIPGVKEFVSKTPFSKLPSNGGKLLLTKIREKLVGFTKNLWQHVLEVKELSATKGLSRIPKAFPKFHFPKPTLNFFRPADTPEYYLGQAQESLTREDYEDAERKFIKVIEKDPHNEEAFAGLGKLYLAQKKFDEAIETYKFLIKHYPGNDTNYSNLGQAYHGQKLYDLAVDAYERAIELAPTNTKRYINLGLTLEAKKHPEEAILNYRKAVELEDQNTQYLLILAEALVKRNETAEAEMLLEQILVLEPTNHLAREKLMQLKF